MKVTRQFSFSAGHALSNYEGKCKNLHGHNYIFEVAVSGPVNNGMVVDFGDLKRIVGPIIEALDHRMLIDESDPKAPLLTAIDPTVISFYASPTAENILQWLASVITPAIYSTWKGTVRVEGMSLRETDNCYASL